MGACAGDQQAEPVAGAIGAHAQVGVSLAELADALEDLGMCATALAGTLPAELVREVGGGGVGPVCSGS